MGAALGVLLSGVSGATIPDWLADRIRDGLAGVILFAENTPDLPRTRTLTDDLRNHRANLVICVDEEGGDVTRLQARHGSSFPTPAALGVVDDPTLTARCAELLGRLIATAGIDLDLAPVLDVASEPDNPVIGVRSFGADPELVARHGRAYADGLARAGVASCAKHYPGHGATRTDSHLGDAIVDVSATELAARDEAPFAPAGVDAVMTAHVRVPALGDEPASISAWAAERLRAAGFEGPILTDALGMRAIADRMSLGEACVRALEAGADLLCLDSPQNRDPEQALIEAEAAIEAGLACGRLDADRLAASAVRNRGLHRRTRSDGQTREAADTGRTEDELAELGLEIARRAVVVHGDPRLTGVPVVVDLRRRHNIAASGSGPVAAAVAELWPTTTRTDDPCAVDPGRPVLALTAAPGSDPAEREALQRLRRAHPDPVLLHLGVAATAPAGVRGVCAHGAARANIRAALTRLLPASPSAAPRPEPADHKPQEDR